MYLIQILAIVIWLSTGICAFFNFKKTVLFWMMLRLLLNNQIAVRYDSPGMSLAIAIDVTLILIYFFNKIINRQTINLRVDKFPILGALGLTLVSFMLSSLFSIVPLNLGFVATLKYFISNYGIIFVFFKCLNTKEDVYLYIKMGFIVSIIVTCLGLYESIFKNNPWLDFVYFNSPHNESTSGRMYYVPLSAGGHLQIRLGMLRAYSTFGIHIAFGTACLFLMYLFMTMSKYRFLYISKIRLYIVILLLLAGVLASNSKTPLVGVLVLLFAFYRLNEILNIKVITPVVILFIIIFIYFPNIIMNFMTLFDSDMAVEAGGSTVDGRLQQFEIALKLFSLNPLLGNGIGSIAAMKDIGNNELILGAESSLMQILPERGLLGLVAYIVTYLLLFKYGKKYLPFNLCFFFLLSVAIMEFATGVLDMPIWVNVYLCVVRLFQIRFWESYLMKTHQRKNYE